ncbi:threonine synthase [Parvularcula sp. LCG005]|uniref:threonine synthase n=1 Tax=Parvularcula sp. LCG005 TaxID=3078805 RepID=UPI00294239EE|nr:threonine synthase [Parvularcula sp. LCG005]WOI53681.1 threonine synthase [Parvularcula sp. LCG005]
MAAQVSYSSTRGQSPELSFDDVLLTGLAPDGGLYAPDHWPTLSKAELKSLAGQPYQVIARAVISPFLDDTVSDAELGEMIDAAYGRFAHPAVAPVLQTGPADFMMELHHGPTLAFKDVAMQLLGHLFAARLKARGRQMTIVAATSGDTGGAAIDAMANRPGVNICVLHPNGRISEVQRRFMTTVEADNVLNIAVEGNFDDCQALVKAMFADVDFRDAVSLGAVNSINWARIVAQIVYYVSTSLTLSRDGEPVHFCVPTGNFGDIFAGFVAKQMGAPVGHLVVATNENDILNRAMRQGAYKPDGVIATQSPSMDIQVSSNFERLLYIACGRDAELVRELMGSLKEGGFVLPQNLRAAIAPDFSSYRASEEATAAKIAQIWRETGQLIDPHTAVGLVAADGARANGLKGTLVTLSTAHAAKFPDAVESATGVRPDLPARCRDLYARDEVMTVLPNDYAAVTDYIRKAFEN